MQVEMQIKGLMVDPVTNMPIVILKDDSESRVLPIWVGIFEANAIAIQIEKILSPRPMTHDLLCNIIDALQAKAEKIVITDLRDNTFFALVHLDQDGRHLEIDARPSDAMALALRLEVPIFVEQEVLVSADTEGGKDSSDAERLRKWFENLDPDEFSKYEM